MEYKTKIITFKDGFKMLSISIMGDQYWALNDFLIGDGPQFEDWYLEDFEKVLSGKEKHISTGGNCTDIEMGPEETTITSLFAPEDMPYPSFTMNTRELRDLLIWWCGEKRKFEEEQKRK